MALFSQRFTGGYMIENGTFYKNQDEIAWVCNECVNIVNTWG